jgi:DNA-binding NarL/FixJ family response regulator
MSPVNRAHAPQSFDVGDAESSSSSGAPIRLILVDDHQFYRAALAHALEAEPDLTVAEQASSFVEARDFFDLRCGAVDVALLDLHLPDGSGIDLIRHLRRACPVARALVIAGDFDMRDKAQAVEAGAFGYLLKTATLEEMVSVIRRVAAGEPMIGPRESIDLLRLLDRDHARQRAIAQRVEPLTERETEILQAIAEGATDREIAAAFQISPHTVHTHITHMLEKLGAHSRTQAVVEAVRAGLIEIE